MIEVDGMVSDFTRELVLDLQHMQKTTRRRMKKNKMLVMIFFSC